jgi:hypothetical protein
VNEKWIVSRFNIGGKVMNAGPEIFVAQVGVVFSIVALLLFFSVFQIPGLVVASIMGFPLSLNQHSFLCGG